MSNEIERLVVEAAIRGLIQSGHIDPRGKSQDQILSEVGEYTKAHNVEWVAITDHKSDIVDAAKKLIEGGHKDEALVLYATLVEHTLNFIIKNSGVRSGLNQAHVITLLKDTQIRAKFILAHLLHSVPLDDEQYNRVHLINSVRNEFIHYKWSDSDDDRNEARLKGALESFSFLHQYLESFTENHINRGFKYSRNHKES